VYDHGYVLHRMYRSIFVNHEQMARSRRNLNDSRPQSPTDDLSSDEQDARSPQEAPRGRTGKQTKSETKPEAMDTAA
jgi:choline-phosphate cytidylyltransferase